MSKVFYFILFVFFSTSFAFSQDLTTGNFTLLGGDTTSFFPGPAALQVFAPNVTSPEHQAIQLDGFSPFHRLMKPEEGMGPRFVNASCGGCHFQNGRGPISFNNSALLFSGGSVIIKVRAPDGEINIPPAGPVLQNHSTDGKKYHDIRLRWNVITGKYPDGTKYKLRKPDLSFEVDGTSYRKYLYSMRMSPAIIGAGLLESVSVTDVMANADPRDKNKDGISGRPNIVDDVRKGTISLGRFGYKGIQPTVEQQSAAAAANEMGMANILFMPNGEAETDLSESELNKITVYQKLGGVPAARNQTDSNVQKGIKLFFDIGCESCHKSTFVTGESDFPELEDQTIHPFSDLLLHDMGPGLSDNLSEGMAKNSEWRTTPLWGLGFTIDLTEVKANFLHDGRARSIEEAIIWHDGEAKISKDNFMNLTKSQRKELIAFLKSL